MTRLLTVIGFVICVLTLSQAQVPAPAFASSACGGQVYRAAKVARPARLIDFGELTIPQEAKENKVRGTVVINAVLCRNGRVADINVVKGLPFGVTLSAINKLLNLRFTPAELNFHSVSQALQFQFEITESGTSTKLVTEFASAPPRLVEEVMVMGNRRTPADRILAQLKTRLGEPYIPDQINRDLQSLLRTGDFDKMGTRVIVEDASRGGVRVIFELVELPLIIEIKFLNATIEEQATLVEGLRKHLNLRWGAVLDPHALLAANRIIAGFYKSKGAGEVKVESSIECPTVTEAIVIFKITPAKIGP